jgi:hypothetical protein
MSKKAMYLCGVPMANCTGGRFVGQNLMPDSIRHGHASRDAAFRCHKNYLVKVLGFTQIGQREFASPNNGPIRVLTKKTRFGGRLRLGKEGNRYMYNNASGVVY